VANSSSFLDNIISTSYLQILLEIFYYNTATLINLF